MGVSLRSFAGIQFRLSARTRALLSGVHVSWRLGQGERFSDLKPYEHGDPVRRIDWRFEARTGRLAIRRYEEPRVARILLFYDVSDSMRMSTAEGGRAEAQDELLSSLQWLADGSGDVLIPIPFVMRDLPITRAARPRWRPELILWVSDGLEPAVEVARSLACLRSWYPHETIRAVGLIRADEREGLQVPLVRDPEHAQCAMFDTPQSLQRYRSAMQTHRAEVHEAARQLNIRWAWAQAEDPARAALYLTDPERFGLAVR